MASTRRATWVSLAITAALLLVALGSVNWSFVATLSADEALKWWRPLATAGLVTLSLTACAVSLGLTLGIFIAVTMWMPIGRVATAVLNLYIEIGRNVPMIVLLFWIHFALPLLTGISTSAFVSGFVALAFQSSAYLADITRGGIQSINPGQWQAAYALGLPRRWIWAEVILPQAIRTMLPAIGVLATSSLNVSSLLSLLGVAELTNTATKISDYAMRPIEVMTATALLYLSCNLLVATLFNRLERRFSRAPHAV